MMKKLVLVVAFSGLGALVLGSLLLATDVGHAGVGDIFGTDHDVGTGLTPTCMVCHLPHNAYEDYLWYKTPASYPGWEGSKILPLCFSCHDGTETSKGLYIVDEPDLHNHPLDIGFEPYRESCLQCKKQDCAKCHDPHDNAWVFLDAERFTSQYQNPSFCTFCHTDNHGVAIDTPLGMEQTHPEGVAATLPVGADDDWDGNTDDFLGTPLWGTDADGDPIATGSTGDVRCMTCHRAHGAQPGAVNRWKWSSRNSEWELSEGIDTLNSMVISQEVTEGTDTYYRSPICVNCHE